MKIKKIELVNYRNHQNITVDLSDNINVICGNNGSGKTNIAESIYFISYLKSFRTNNDQELINFNSDFAKINILNEDNYEIVLSKNSKKCIINNVVYKKQSDYLGKLKSVVFSPESIDILIKSPSERRKYIDMLICMVDPTYINTIKEFTHIIKQRNDYLKQMYINNLSDKTYLEVLNDKLISTSKIIYEKRSATIDDLSIYANTIFKNFFDFDFEIIYEVQSGIDLNNIEETLKNKLEQRYDRELALGTTITGPSRDDLVFNINNHNAKFYSSKGQQRIILISLKLAEVEIIREKLGTVPILILDDVLSELDEVRQNYLFAVLNQKSIQTIITTTDINEIKKNLEFNVIEL